MPGSPCGMKWNMGNNLQGKIETRVGIFVLVALAIFGYMGFKIGAFPL